MSPIHAAAAFGVGLLLTLGIAWLGRRSTGHCVLSARLQGQTIDDQVSQLTVGVALVTDDTLLSDAALTFAKVRYVAIGTIERRS